jgi:hypothetical protein
MGFRSRRASPPTTGIRTGRWDGIRRPPPTRAESPRAKLSRRKCYPHESRKSLKYYQRATAGTKLVLLEPDVAARFRTATP